MYARAVDFTQKEKLFVLRKEALPIAASIGVSGDTGWQP
jgi:hypothetical protein